MSAVSVRVPDGARLLTGAPRFFDERAMTAPGLTPATYHRPSAPAVPVTLNRRSNARGMLRVLRKVVGDRVPGRLRAGEDVRLWVHARVVVERAHRDDGEAAIAVDARQDGAAGAAEDLCEALCIGDFV